MQSNKIPQPQLKVVHLTTVHIALDTRIFHKECKALSQTGYDVMLIAPGSSNRVIDNINIISIPQFESRIKRMTLGMVNALIKVKKVNADVFHFHDPELIPVGLLLKLVGHKVIYDVHEDVPKQILDKPWIPNSLRKITSWFVEKLEIGATKYFDGIVAATPAIAARFPKEKTITVQNFSIIRQQKQLSVDHFRDQPDNLAYVGSITEARGIIEMLQMMDELPNRNEVKLLLAGRFCELEVEKRAHGLSGWAHVDFLGWLSQDEVAALLKRSKIGLVVLHPIGNYINDSYPVKLFEYMAAGIPVIASDFPLWRQIVEESQCGLLVDPLEPAAIASAVQRLLDNPVEAARMGQNGQKAAVKNFNWNNEAEKLLNLYRTVLARSE